MPKKIPTRLYGRRAMGPSAGGTIWGGAFSPTRGFPATFPVASSKAAEPIDEVPAPEPVPPVDAVPPTEVQQPAVPLVVPPTTEVQQSAIPLAEPPAEPNFVPATPVPYQPEQINGFKTELNADGTRSIFINSSRITIPDLDILAAIPD
ncbi:hypothetical protein [Terribacillus sp. DMT04]|uniref:hypothetical protein n=1 Tax=Terribacillus sp. DMT04 TaxID=2850441 RepID=UPI001C2BBBB4|nr:hypothetical protein [Terribacillus sp. DMT04]QXE01394.1 hypothetical protein KS242_15635 [Terribacillus sp. DMT04]